MPEDLVTDLSVLAAAEDRAGHGQESIDVERIALRQGYVAGPTDAIAASHDSLGNYLARNASDFPRALGHHLAAALLFCVTGSGEYTRHSLISVARDLAQLPSGSPVPATVGELSAAVAEVPGVHLDRLLARLNGDPAAIGTNSASSSARPGPGLIRTRRCRGTWPRGILDGERAPALARGLDPILAAVVLTVLFHLPPASRP